MDSSYTLNGWGGGSSLVTYWGGPHAYLTWQSENPVQVCAFVHVTRWDFPKASQSLGSFLLEGQEWIYFGYTLGQPRYGTKKNELELSFNENKWNWHCPLRYLRLFTCAHFFMEFFSFLFSWSRTMIFLKAFYFLQQFTLINIYFGNGTSAEYLPVTEQNPALVFWSSCLGLLIRL